MTTEERGRRVETGGAVSEFEQVYVELVGEGILVWRPVHASHLHGNVYKIVDQPYDRDAEAWAFEPGQLVVCELTDSADGQILAAVRAADEDATA